MAKTWLYLFLRIDCLRNTNGDITYVERLLRSHVIENKSPCSVLQNDIVLRTMADDELHIMQ